MNSQSQESTHTSLSEGCSLQATTHLTCQHRWQGVWKFLDTISSRQLRCLLTYEHRWRVYILQILPAQDATSKVPLKTQPLWESLPCSILYSPKTFPPKFSSRKLNLMLKHVLVLSRAIYIFLLFSILFLCLVVCCCTCFHGSMSWAPTQCSSQICLCSS